MDLLFKEQPIKKFFQENDKLILNSIARQSENSIAEGDLSIIAETLVSEFRISNIEFDNLDDLNPQLIKKKENINRNRGEYSRTGMKDSVYIVYTLKYNNANPDLFKCEPSRYTPQFDLYASVSKQIVKFEIPANYANEDLPDHIIDEVRRRREEIVSFVVSITKHINNEVTEYNNALKETILNALMSTKKEIMRKKDIKSRL